MAKFFHLLLLHFFWCAYGFTQQLNNSIVQQAGPSKLDTSSVWQLYSKAWSAMYSKPDNSLIDAHRGLLLAQKLHFKRGEMACMYAFAEACNETGNYSKSLQVSRQELKLAKNINNQKQVCAALSGIASAYAFEHKPELAIRYFYKAKTLATVNNFKSSLIAITDNLSEEYEEVHQLDSATVYANECLRLSSIENNIDFTGCALANLATINMMKNNTSAGMSYFRKAIPCFLQTNDHEYLCRCYFEIATFFQQSKQMDSALYYGNRCMQMALGSHIAEWTIKGSGFLMNYYKATHNTDSVSVYHTIYLAAKNHQLIKKEN